MAILITDNNKDTQTNNDNTFGLNISSIRGTNLYTTTIRNIIASTTARVRLLAYVIKKSVLSFIFVPSIILKCISENITPKFTYKIRFINNASNKKLAHIISNVRCIHFILFNKDDTRHIIKDINTDKHIKVITPDTLKKDGISKKTTELDTIFKIEKITKCLISIKLKIFCINLLFTKCFKYLVLHQYMRLAYRLIPYIRTMQTPKIYP